MIGIAIAVVAAGVAAGGLVYWAIAWWIAASRIKEQDGLRYIGTPPRGLDGFVDSMLLAIEPHLSPSFDAEAFLRQLLVTFVAAEYVEAPLNVRAQGYTSSSRSCTVAVGVTPRPVGRTALAHEVAHAALMADGYPITENTAHVWPVGLRNAISTLDAAHR